jgi:hypothetical protein
VSTLEGSDGEEEIPTREVEAEHRGGLGAVAGQQHLKPYTSHSNRKRQTTTDFNMSTEVL